MNQFHLLKHRGFLIAAIILIIAIMAVFYYSRTRSNSEQLTDQQQDVAAPSTLSSTATLPSSPVSPLSPISPLEDQPTSTSADPEVIQGMIDRGIELYEAKNYEAAINTFNEILAIDPNNFIVYNARGNVYVALGDYEKAINDFSRTSEIEQNFPHAYYNRGRVYYMLEKYDEALTDFQKSIELAPAEFGYRANGNIGLIYHKQGQYDKALEAYNESMSYDDSKADVFYLRGETYTALEEYQNAIADYRAAIERFSRYDKAYQSLGYAYYKTGQFDQAMEALNQALEITPANPTAHLYKMLIYVTMNEIEQAQTEGSQGIAALSALPEEDRQLLLDRVKNELEAFAEENPNMTGEVAQLRKLIETK